MTALETNRQIWGTRLRRKKTHSGWIQMIKLCEAVMIGLMSLIMSNPEISMYACIICIIGAVSRYTNRMNQLAGLITDRW